MILANSLMNYGKINSDELKIHLLTVKGLDKLAIKEQVRDN